jgi:hypothetical protein
MRPLIPMELLRGVSANTTIESRVAIQARIAEWQRQYRNSDYGPADFLFGDTKSRADHARWFRAA